MPHSRARDCEFGITPESHGQNGMGGIPASSDLRIKREEVGEMLVDRAHAGLRGRRRRAAAPAAVDELADRPLERAFVSPRESRCRRRGTRWSSAAPRSGTISGMPLARASAATMQNVSASQPWTSASALASRRASSSRSIDAGQHATRCHARSPGARAGASRPVADEQQADVASARATSTARITMSHRFSAEKRPMPSEQRGARIQAQAKPGHHRARSASEAPAKTRPRLHPHRDGLAHSPIAAVARAVRRAARWRRRQRRTSGRARAGAARTSRTSGRWSRSARSRRASDRHRPPADRQCMTSDRVAAPCQRPTIVALDQGEDASTWSGCHASSAAVQRLLVVEIAIAPIDRQRGRGMRDQDSARDRGASTSLRSPGATTIISWPSRDAARSLAST